MIFEMLPKNKYSLNQAVDVGRICENLSRTAVKVGKFIYVMLRWSKRTAII